MSLVLSPLQQRWLQELQVATPFFSPYREQKAGEPTPTPASVSQQLKVAVSVATPPPVVAPPAPMGALKPVQFVDLSQMSLMQLQAHAEQCESCDLHQQRSQIVLGAGQTQQPEWFVISTAPSSHEELAGLPMQGKSGELFTAQMQSIGVHVTEQMYLTQLLKCRSLSNKIPAEHIAACQRILQRQIELIQPQALLLLGSKAAALFLGTALDFEGLRGQVHSWEDAHGRKLPVVVSYHPASLLLRPQFKAQAWQDLKLMASLRCT